jgi:hypothetical protein
MFQEGVITTPSFGFIRKEIPISIITILANIQKLADNHNTFIIYFIDILCFMCF